MINRTRITAIGGFPRRFLCREDGAAAVYVSIMIVVLIGFVGLAVDFSRLYTTNSQAQDAADAAAIAGASQLDGTSTAITRATAAVQGTPLTTNNQTWAEGDATVQITNIRFLHSLPALDTDPITDAYVTTDPESARFIEVHTELLEQKNVFMSALGMFKGQTNATAVAGFKEMVCRYPPLMMCNPYETATDKSFPIEDLVGVTLLAKTKEGGTEAWAPGDMGLLDPPQDDWDTSTNTGAKEVAEEIAKSTPERCYDSPVSIRPGQVDAMRTAINVRFDIYDNPFFGSGKARKDIRFRPARNVTKGKVTTMEPVYDPNDPTIQIGEKCVQSDPPPGTPPKAMALPPDDCFGPDFSNPVQCLASVAPSREDRLGNGVWDRDTYWAVNHTDGAGVQDIKPVGFSTMSRYELYRYEIDSGKIPNNTATGTSGITDGEDGNPMCYEGSLAPNDTPDRRILYMAVINCIEEGPLSGSSNDNVNVKDYVRMFLIRPIEGGSDTNIWLEFVERVNPGDDEGVLHDMVQLYR